MVEVRRPNLLRWTTIAVEILLVIGVLFVLRDNRSLRRSLKATASLAPRFAARGEVASLPVLDLDGKSSTLDLRNGRFVIAVIDPTCSSCAAVLKDAQASNVFILSVADAALTKKLLGNLDSAERTLIADRSRGTPQIFSTIPQVFTVDHGTVVRTCANVRECL